MQLLQRISMDFAVHGIPPRIYGKQDDSLSRVVQISLYNAGAAWDIPAGASMMLRYRTASGAIGLYDTLPDGSSPFAILESNVISIVLVDQIFSSAGLTECELRIIAEGSGISTWTFLIEVERSASGDATIPSDYINVLTNLASQVAADAKRAEDAANSVDTTYVMNKTMYDPSGAVEAAGGIPKYVETNAPKVTVEDSVTSTSTTNAASAASVKKAYDQAASYLALQKGAVNGVASLGSDGKVPSSQLPDIGSSGEEVSATVYVSGDQIGSATPYVQSVVRAGGVVIAIINLIFAPSVADYEYSIKISGLPAVVGRGLIITSTHAQISPGLIPTLRGGSTVQATDFIASGDDILFSITFDGDLSIANYGIGMALIYATT